MRQSAVGEPEFLVETFCIDNERVTFPFADGSAIVERIVRIAAKLALLCTPVGIDDAIVSIAATYEGKHTFPVTVFIELNSVRQLILPGPTRRHAVQKHRVVFKKTALPELVQISGPFLERSNLVDIGDVLQKAISVHLNRTARLNKTCGRGTPPISSLSWTGAEPRL